MLRLRAVAASTTTAALSAGHIRDLFSAIAASKSERGTVGEQSGVKAARLSAIKADIAARLCDPHLDAIGVAKRVGIRPPSVRPLVRSEERRGGKVWVGECRSG